MNDFQDDIKKCLQQLLKGNTILYPTDTVWGIGCDATNAVAVEKIINIKKRPQNKSFIILVSDEKMLKNYIASTHQFTITNFLLEQKTPTTIIYPISKNLAHNVPSADGSIAIRICREPFCQALLQALQKPLLSTSANLSGIATPLIFKEIAPEIIQSVDYVVQYRQTDTTITPPSSIFKAAYDEENGIALQKIR